MSALVEGSRKVVDLLTIAGVEEMLRTPPVTHWRGARAIFNILSKRKSEWRVEIPSFGNFRLLSISLGRGDAFLSATEKNIDATIVEHVLTLINKIPLNVAHAVTAGPLRNHSDQDECDYD